MYRSSPLRSTLITNVITGLDMCSMYRSCPFRSTLNTNVITGLDMCEVCTQAVHSLSETVFTISTTLTRFYGTTGIFRLHFRGAFLQIRQPFHDSVFGTRQIRRPLQGRRISRVTKTTLRCHGNLRYPPKATPPRNKAQIRPY